MSGNFPRKDLFELPDNLVYLDGNSLGPLSKAAVRRAEEVIHNEWSKQLILAWNTADWITLPKRVGDRIAGLIGAPDGSVATGDTLSIKVYQALAAALRMRPDRKTILSDSGNFPSDLYMASGLLELIDGDYEFRIVPPESVAEAIDDSLAAVLLTEVDYRTGRLHDMAGITGLAHEAGAVMIWDIAHSAGAFPVDVSGCGTEFAVGCTYKYLNGGPGAPAFIYVRPDIILDTKPALAGWLGHEEPFAMERQYRPAMSTERMRVGTPPVIQLSILDTALDVWDDIDLAELRVASMKLSEQFIAGVGFRCPQLTLASPRDAVQRGSQVSFTHEHGYAVMQAAIERGLIGDFRPPNIMRFGITPLFLDCSDIARAVGILDEVLTGELWHDPKYQAVSRVT